jgi:hypothetical protein
VLIVGNVFRPGAKLKIIWEICNFDFNYTFTLHACTRYSTKKGDLIYIIGSTVAIYRTV